MKLGQTTGYWETKKCPECGFIMNRPPYRCPRCIKMAEEAREKRSQLIANRRANGFDSFWDPQ